MHTGRFNNHVGFGAFRGRGNGVTPFTGPINLHSDSSTRRPDGLDQGIHPGPVPGQFYAFQCLGIRIVLAAEDRLVNMQSNRLILAGNPGRIGKCCLVVRGRVDYDEYLVQRRH